MFIKRRVRTSARSFETNNLLRLFIEKESKVILLSFIKFVQKKKSNLSLVDGDADFSFVFLLKVCLYYTLFSKINQAKLLR